VKNRRLLIVIGSIIGIFIVSIAIPLLFMNDRGPDQAFTAAGTPQSDLSPLQTRRITPALAASVPEDNCTYPLEFWRERPTSWPEHVTVGERSYNRDEMIAIFRDLEADDLARRLLRNLYVTFLNILHGADMMSVEGVILDANDWLTLNPIGSPLSEFNQRRGAELVSLLEGYNNGIFGPGACPDIPLTGEIIFGDETEVPNVALLITETPFPGTGTQQGGTGVSQPSPIPTVVVQPVQPPAPASPTDPPPPSTPTNPPPPPPTNPPPPSPTDPPPPEPTNPPPPPPPTNTPEPTLQPPSPTNPPPPPPTSTPVPTLPPTDTPLPTLPLPTNTLVPTLPPPPPPSDGVCSGAFGAVTVESLTVPSGASCTLNGTRIEGNIDIESGASLVANSIFATGNLRGRNSSRVEVLSGSFIGGNLRVEYGGSARVVASSINGNLVFDSNGSSVEASGNQVGGNLEAEKNTGGVGITNNNISGNLKCKDNSPPPTGGGNAVGGNAEDQCANLN
jgi:hypothetical protein